MIEAIEFTQEQKMNKLLIVDSATMAVYISSLFPDFKVLGKGCNPQGESFDIIIVACRLNQSSDVKWLDNCIRPRLTNKDRKLIIL